MFTDRGTVRKALNFFVEWPCWGEPLAFGDVETVDVKVTLSRWVDYKFDFTAIGIVDCVLFAGNVYEIGFIGGAKF